jgi:hypothetical protein
MGRRLIMALFCAVAFFGTINAYAAIDTTPLVYMPFGEGEPWYCTQGPNGSYSHTGDVAWAYDFVLQAMSAYGRPIYSPVNGTVEVAIENQTDYSGSGGWGNTIVIRADRSNYYVRIAHMMRDSIPSNVGQGAYVTQGQLIGMVGSSGSSTAPHVHMQVQSASAGTSIEFDFVEGRIRAGDTVQSLLRPNKYIIDNDGRANLGAPLRSILNRTNGATFSTYSWASYINGDDYMTTSTSGGQFVWQFIPTSTRAFNVHVNCRGGSTRDSRTSYRISGPNVSRTALLDQRNLNGMIYIGAGTFQSGSAYTVTATRGTGNMCVDSVVLTYW